MITETLEGYAKNENKTDALNEIIDAIKEHDDILHYQNINA